MAAGLQNRVVRIARPIDGLPGPDDFEIRVEPVPEPGEGQALVRTIYISIAPGVRPLMPYAGERPDVAQDSSAGRVDASADAVPNPSRIRVGEAMRAGMVPSDSKFAGGTVGRVIASRHPDFRVGDYAFGGRYWQDYEAIDGASAIRLDPAELPIEADLGLIGRSAFTGWVGYRRICNARPGETILVSAAAGSVGMLVVQLAKADGLHVVGIASGADKCAFVTRELGADACIDRMGEDVGAALDRLCPAGVDIYFDNVGGAVQRPIFDRLKPFGRLIVCGMAASYCGGGDTQLPTGIILGKRLRIEGFVVLDYDDDYPAFRSEIARLWREGRIHYRQLVYEGLESAPRALADCLSGRSSGGKILVQVAPDDSRAERS
ncbi:NADP-dependent oxidoreductase [Flavisphingomonas formosensis]|uniref:NADP-dependent oxidoreductase n=1 Tax=Flavisphingomonas formosensis TaxID=861534 RepID=UPI0018DFCAC8|nr:NADP-dependent oxidoreductase [Sphingomonas formosensis]